MVHRYNGAAMMDLAYNNIAAVLGSIYAWRRLLSSRGKGVTMRITARLLKDKCLTANHGVLKSWPFGLAIGRTETG